MKIRRPLFIIALSILVVIYAINTMPKSAIMFSLALFALFIIIHRITKNKYTYAMALSFAAALVGILLFKFYNARLQDKIDCLSSFETVTVNGQITAYNRRSSAAFYTVDLKDVNGEPVDNIKVSVYADDILQPGMTVRMTGKFSPFSPKSNYIYNYSKGVFAYFYPDSMEVTAETGTMSAYFYNIKEKLISASEKIFSYKTVDIAVAMGLGDKTNLDNGITEAFTYTGLSHALVVSGTHVSFIVTAVNLILSLLPMHKKIKNITAALFILFFIAIIGPEPSVIRAGVLAVAFLTGRNLILEIDNLTVMAIVILITLSSNPYSANNVGLLLSYFAYFGVIYAYGIAKEKEWNAVQTALAVTVYAQLFTLPVMSMTGMDVTLLSPVFNLIMAFPIMAICIMSFFLPFIYYIPAVGAVICSIMAPINDILINIIVKTARLAMEKLDFAMVNLSADGVIFAIWFSAAATGVILVQFNKTTLRKISLFVVPVLSLLCYNYINIDVVTLQVFDGSSYPAYYICYKDENYLVTAENINRSTLTDVMYDLKTDGFTQIIYCSAGRTADTDVYGEYTDNITVLKENSSYKNELFSVTANTKSRATAYVLDIDGVSIAFSHNKADFSATKTDIYFFGKEAPGTVNSDEYYCFYPVNKDCAEYADKTQAVILYDTLTIKINRNTGRYTIVKDVKNFGSQL